MTNTTMTSRSTAALEMRWVETTDARGRSVMEAHWVLAGEELAAAHAA